MGEEEDDVGMVNSIGILVIVAILFAFIFVMCFYLLNAYSYSDNNIVVGIFAPRNETIWERTKLIITSVLIAGIIAAFLGKYVNNVWFATFIASIIGIITLLLVDLIVDTTGDIILELIGYFMAISITIIFAFGSFFGILFREDMSKQYQNVGIIGLVLLWTFIAIQSCCFPAKI